MARLLNRIRSWTCEQKKDFNMKSNPLSITEIMSRAGAD